MPDNSYGTMPSLIGTMVTLVIVLLAAWVLIKWLLKRMPSQAGSRYIKLLDRLPVAPDKYLLLVRVGGRTMLIGMSSHTVEKLSEFQDPDPFSEDSSESGEAPGGFPQKLMDAFKQRKGGEPD